jgi:cyanophycinase
MGSENSDREITESKGSLVISGGGSRPNDMINRMIDEADLRNGGYAVILPMSSSVPDSAIIWSSEQFFNNGITSVAGFNFEPGKDPNEQWIDSLRNASIIYISGGDQNRFMSIVANTPIETAIHEAWKNGAMIAGTSAGAAVMSEKMITGNELRNPDYTETYRTIESQNLELAKGLGLLKTAIIDQHFVWRSRHNRLFTAIIEHPELLGIGIDESTAILVKGNTAEVVGESQVMVFSNPDKSGYENNHKLGARNLKIDLYLHGEIFKLN